MTQRFFPPDVSLRLGGNRPQAQTHIGDARTLLFKAINTGLNPTALVRNFDDGTTIIVRIAGNQKIVSISAAVMPVAPAPYEPTFPTPTFESREVPLMYSGWTRTHSIVSSALREFTPSDACATAYELVQEWQDVEKLYTTPVQVATITPSQFSGGMKRVVQALLGLGRITDASPAYLTGLTNTAERTINATYSPQWTKTHGIIKAGPQNHWLVEVSQDRGVLAMPLILVPSTVTRAYYRYMETIGDTDTIKVLDEFGGLPNGETFPTNSVALQNYINEGKILQVLTAAQMEPFYKNNGPFSAYDGWAFPDTAQEASNVCWKIYPTVGSGNLALLGQHWRLRFTFSEHDASQLALDPPQPIGTAGAVLELVSQSAIDYWALEKIFVPVNTKHYRSFVSYYGFGGYDGNALLWYVNAARAGGQLNIPTTGFDLRVFYEGNTLQRLKFVQGRTWSAYGVLPQIYSTHGFVLNDPALDYREIHSYNPPGPYNDLDSFCLMLPEVRDGYAVQLCRAVGTIPTTGPVVDRREECTTLCYFAGIGRIDTRLASTAYVTAAGFPPLPVYYYAYNLTIEFWARVAARGTQYVMADAARFISVGDASPVSATNITDADLANTPSYSMNWVGAPD